MRSALLYIRRMSESRPRWARIRNLLFALGLAVLICGCYRCPAWTARRERGRASGAGNSAQSSSAEAHKHRLPRTTEHLLPRTPKRRLPVTPRHRLPRAMAHRQRTRTPAQRKPLLKPLLRLLARAMGPRRLPGTVVPRHIPEQSQQGNRCEGDAHRNGFPEPSKRTARDTTAQSIH